MAGTMSAGRPVFLLFALLFAGAAGSKVTPVEKVVELLENLEKKVTEEGASEAAAYDKYACFCKEQADEKTYAIEKSEAKITMLSTEITELNAEIAQLNTDIGALSTKIGKLDAAIVGETGTRANDRAVYVAKEADASGAIAAVKGAIDAMKGSKGNMEGHTDMEDELVQVRSVAVLAMATKSTMRSSLTEAQWKVVGDLAKQPKSGEAYQYEYHSNDIIATLEALLTTFTGIKNEVDQQEFDLRSASEKKILGLQNEKKFAEKEKAEKSALMEKKTEQKEATEDERSKETEDKNSDLAFRGVLTEECQLKATTFDQRSSTRAGELTAISQAISSLKEGVAPNYGANKKLNGLIQKEAFPSAPKGHWVYVEDKPTAAARSFLQLRGSRAAKPELQLAQKVQAFLTLRADKIHSSVLSAIAMKVHSQEDHFVKVRTLIKDLLAKLQSDSDSEATQKGFCDKEMSAAVQARDKQQGIVEESTASLAMMDAKVQQLREEIALLSQQISDNKKALNEATTLREIEKADNLQTVADAGAGKEAVEAALQTLKTFYGGALGLVQKKYTPPKSDRSGATVGDLAPDVFESEDYKGSQESSKGILGMLEVILSDFDRTVATVTSDEETMEGKYQEFKTTNEGDTTEKEGSKGSKERLITETEDNIVAMKDILSSAEGSHASAEAELTKLSAMCVAGEETYAERVEKRNKEIEALKEAHGILEGWQGF